MYRGFCIRRINWPFQIFVPALYLAVFSVNVCLQSVYFRKNDKPIQTELKSVGK